MTEQNGVSTIPELGALRVRLSSVSRDAGVLYALVHTDDDERRLAVLAEPSSAAFAGFEGSRGTLGDATLLLCPLNARNAHALRERLTWLSPVVLGLRTTAGLGDRLGLATPGHLRAVRAAGGSIAPLPAQQSIREMSRTERTAQQVMDDAMWGVFAEGWRSGFGADADHLKIPDDIDTCLAAGFTFYTFDPGDHVDHTAASAPAAQLAERFGALPWDRLRDTPAALRDRYLDHTVVCEGYHIAFDEATLQRAAVKYGRAIAHVALMYRHLEEAGRGRAWEVEISVDETETPTSHPEHVYIATELRRLGIRVVSLAPRFIGRFEKGVDYIGDLDAFAADFAVHAAIARTLGPYKISLHSGSDKFSIYGMCAEETRGMVHLKTAGTSYLEALRTVASLDPGLLRDIYVFSRDHYERDRASYHVSARLDAAPDPQSLSDAALPGLLDQFDSRQILHVAFGSVLTERDGSGQTRFRDRLLAALKSHAEAYAATLETHFLRHLQPFAPWSRSA